MSRAAARKRNIRSKRSAFLHNEMIYDPAICLRQLGIQFTPLGNVRQGFIKTGGGNSVKNLADV